MPRGIYNRKNKNRSASRKQADSTADLDLTTYTSIKGWEDLSINEQQTVVKEGQETSQALAKEGTSKLEVGQHLSNIQDILEPHNMFQKFVRNNFRFSLSTAYRYITGFKNAQSHLPDKVLMAAMSRGYNIIGNTEERPLGAYTDAVAKLPVPQDPDETQANEWLDKVEKARIEGRSAQQGANSRVTSISAVAVRRDPETMLKEVVRFFKTRYDALPSNHKVRANWVRTVVGMEIGLLGVGNPTTFTPVALPEDFRATRGRPKGSTNAEAQAA